MDGLHTDAAELLWQTLWLAAPWATLQLYKATQSFWDGRLAGSILREQAPAASSTRQQESADRVSEQACCQAAQRSSTTACCASSTDTAVIASSSTDTCCQKGSGASMNSTACCHSLGASTSKSSTVCCQTSHSSADNTPASQRSISKVTVLYASGGGTARSFAEQLAFAIKSADLPDVSCSDCGSISDPDQLLLASSSGHVVLLVMATWQGGAPPTSAQWFCQWLDDASNDFRVGSAAMSGAHFAVYGCGSSAYEPAMFNAVARAADAALGRLGATRLAPLGLGDEDVGDMTPQFKNWAKQVTEGLIALHSSSTAASITAAAEHQQAAVSNIDTSLTSMYGLKGDADSQDSEASDLDEEEDDQEGPGSEVDMEDIGGSVTAAGQGAVMAKGRRARPAGAAAGKQTSPTSTAADPSAPPEMVTPVVRASLTKQGYRIIGSHSGVKLCRWTKAMMRGRGGCYKHSFYGIESHRCMEATPSLACANKCVFCWRHHTNPVGRSWKWAMDPADFIVDRAVDLHQRMVREYGGAPGVTPEAMQEGMQVRHCALSLVGEPIMYPEINALVKELHSRHISTFLVTNAQFPERIQQLVPVTQLYVSVDAATPETLKAVDRPLFSDYWERFITCLTSLKDKKQRTVYRLTLVKGMNMDPKDIAAYAALVDLGQPDFIEIKGVTYCGDSNGGKAGKGKGGLTMAENVPFHHEVVAFSQAICDARNGEYQLACEHAHSCCVLLARPDRYLVDGQWHTWIDYPRFHQLVASGQPFTSADYRAPTPSWAVFGAAEGGFDPAQTRWKRAKGMGKFPAHSPPTVPAAAAAAAAAAAVAATAS